MGDTYCEGVKESSGGREYEHTGFMMQSEDGKTEDNMVMEEEAET